MSYWEYDEPMWEPSEADIIFDEMKEKFANIMSEEVNQKIKALESDNKYLNSQIDKLVEENKSLRSQINQEESNGFLSSLVESVKNRILAIDNKEERDKEILNFLSIIWNKDFNESSYDTPLWIVAMTNFYSHKDEAIDVLKMFEVRLPTLVENFKLPIDWTESELDLFFENLSKHYVCNGSIYKDNLKYWGGKSLSPVEIQCTSSYSEIPWQFVLRNPLLKQEKYLAKIGSVVEKTHGSYFLRIDQYQNLTDKEIKIILNNIGHASLNRRNDNEIKLFVSKYINLTNDKVLLDKYYETYKDDFRWYLSSLYKMPFEYILKWCSENIDNAYRILQDNKNLSNEQKIQILDYMKSTYEEAKEDDIKNTTI